MHLYIPSLVAKIREELAWIERTIQAEGAAALDKIRGALKRIEGHGDAIHATATEVQADHPDAPAPPAAPEPQVEEARAEPEDESIEIPSRSAPEPLPPGASD